MLQACSNLNNNGTCVDSCPVETMIEGGQIVPNLEFRVEAGTQCIIPPCPGMAMCAFLHGLVTYIFRWLVQTGRSVSYAVSFESSVN